MWWMFNGQNTSLFKVLVISLVFDVGLFSVVIAHIRYVSTLGQQIAALEGSTDIMLHSQSELNELFTQFLSN